MAPLFFSFDICTECSLSIQNSVPKVTLGASTFLQIKSPFLTKVMKNCEPTANKKSMFYNKGVQLKKTCSLNSFNNMIKAYVLLA